MQSSSRSIQSSQDAEPQFPQGDVNIVISINLYEIKNKKENKKGEREYQSSVRQIFSSSSLYGVMS
jgi:hypothetical protein